MEIRNKESLARMTAAIEQAELNTSGEIRVHIESSSKKDPVERAVQVFNKLKMYKTEKRNAVLIYIAYGSHKLSIIGDSGINEVVPPNFWDDIKTQMIEDFRNNRPVEAICTAIISVGDSLKKYFPYESNDVNEQTNEISLGE